MKKNVDKYIANFDELNVLVGGADKENITDTVETILVRAYQRGAKDTQDELEDIMDMEVVFDDFVKAINKKIDGKDFRQRVAENISKEGVDLEAVSKIAETEFHRVYQQACIDTAKRIETDTGRVVVKKWTTVKDNRVRLTHEVLEGVVKPLDERFYTIDGDSAMFPGDFSNAENSIGCRCFLEFSFE